MNCPDVLVDVIVEDEVVVVLDVDELVEVIEVVDVADRPCCKLMATLLPPRKCM